MLGIGLGSRARFGDLALVIFGQLSIDLRSTASTDHCEIMKVLLYYHTCDV